MMVGRETISGSEGLERSCAAPTQDWFHSRVPAEGIELLEARFGGPAFEKHRHDTYAVGLTDSGLQCFSYRGASQASTAGEVIVLYPDEVHDGHAGSAQGFRYRMVYLEPARIVDALRSLSSTPAALPFLPEAVSQNRALARAIDETFTDLQATPVDPLAIDSAVLRFAEALASASPCRPGPRPLRHLDRAALERARQRLSDERHRIVRSDELESLTGLSRYELARQFRALYGTSPYRYLLMRRLADARESLAGADSLADLAVATGFADQAHFTRMFKAAYGLTPARFRLLQRRRTPGKRG